MNVETVVAALITAVFAFLGIYVSNRKQVALVAFHFYSDEKRTM